jgi:trimethylamine:corrinoid methyltransferase-like protein
MIGKIIGAIAGSKVAEHTRGIGGPTGAILGVGAATLARRLSLPALVAVSAGGYFAKKYFDKQQAAKPAAKRAPARKKAATAKA